MAFSRTLLSKPKCFTLLLIVSNLFIISSAAKVLKTPSAAESQRQQSRSNRDMAAAPSIAVDFKVQSVAPRSSSSTGNRRYGYPFLIAPTLGPFIKARSDDFENEANDAPVPKAKSYGNRIKEEGADNAPLKKGIQKKSKVPYTYGATRRQGFDEEDDNSAEKRFRSYREPKYRNFDELETSFRPRRIDYNIPYSEYEYPKSSRRPAVSPRDPYLSPSDDPSDSFYPVPKAKTYPSSYGQSAHGQPQYGAGRYEDSHDYHSDHVHDGYDSGSYDGPSSQYPTSGGHYGYQEDYAIESNKPIIGDIRKRLLDYAGASDLYEGEPDYLRQVARNKHKYGSIGNDYYAYGGPEYRSSYRDFPYVESKIRVIKKSRAL